MRGVRDSATALMNEREMRLVLASAPRNLAALTQRELKALVKRARGMKDRYALRARRLMGEARGKRPATRGRRAQGNANTRRKAVLFQQALGRFEARLAILERAAPSAKPAARVRKSATGKRATPARKRAPARKATATRRAPTAKASRVRGAKKAAAPAGYVRRQKSRGGAQKQRRFSSVNTVAHRTAQGRRQQARRDSRR
ncbi:hypothetical protein JGU66_27035 [Myxococcaceae bacterium JPH2]|nr:hypothetical protein [Myxococcaceae bacterium JPH2]